MGDLRQNQREIGKIYAKFNAKYVRLALIVLTLCEIYAKFNAKDVRSTLNSTQNI